MRLPRLLTPLFTLTLVAPLAAPLAACGSSADVTAPTPAPATATVETTTFASSLNIDLAASGWMRTPAGLYYRTLSAAADTATAAASGQRVTVRYTGWLANGKSFDTGSLPFVLGARAVIAGFDQGVVAMRVGERRRLRIPPALGYGASGTGPIPGNAVLVFDVELLSIG